MIDRSLLILCILLGLFSLKAQGKSYLSNPNAKTNTPGPVNSPEQGLRPPAITVRPFSKVFTKKPIALKDIAVLEGFDGRRNKNLEKLIVSKPLLPGQTISISNITLVNIIKSFKREQSFKSSESQWKIKVPQSIKVLYSPRPINQASVKQHLINHLQKLCKECSFTITNLSVPIVSEAIEFQDWSLSPFTSIPKGSFSTRLRLPNQPVSKSFEVGQNLWIKGIVTTQRKVPVAAKYISIGKHLTASDIKLMNRNISFAIDSTPNLKDIIGQRARKAMRANEIIWSQSLEKDQLISAGAQVEIQLGENLWRISLQGIAQSSGALGDSITVRSPKTKLTYSGIVIGKGKVQLK